MQEHPFQDSGSHLIPMMQAKIKPTLAYQSRRRLKRRDTDCRGYAWEQPLQSSTTNLQDRRKRTEKLRIYSVALRFQTTDGCSSSFAKDIEVKLLTNQKTI